MMAYKTLFNKSKTIVFDYMECDQCDGGGTRYTYIISGRIKHSTCFLCSGKGLLLLNEEPYVNKIENDDGI